MFSPRQTSPVAWFLPLGKELPNVKPVSPSRRYVAICIDPDGNGTQFRSFELPASATPENGLPPSFVNNAEWAAWYFTTRLNGRALLAGMVTVEDYQNLVPQSQPSV